LLNGFARATACAVVALGCALTPALAMDAAKEQVETVHFADPRWPAVRVVRGVSREATSPVVAAPSAAPLSVPVASPGPLFRATAANTEIVTFGDGRGTSVQVVRGSGTEPAGAIRHTETVRFAGPGAPSVNIMRGPTTADSGIELFSAAKGGELDRVAFAVDGAESGHGSNLAMWRPELDGPQGPMQVSAAAALDVGGGDRFDMRQNRLLGRAFLAHMYQRYGNWPDAIAAYNWGPGHLDQWIATGRPVDMLPLETARYLLKVLHDAFLITVPAR
jgi:hypothetical protein